MSFMERDPRSLAGFQEVGLQDLSSLAVVDSSQFEAEVQFGGGEYLIPLFLVEGQDLVVPGSRGGQHAARRWSWSWGMGCTRTCP